MFIGGNNDVLTFFEPRLYKIATAFMLAWPYGNTAQFFRIFLSNYFVCLGYPVIMSSYFFDRSDDAQGPPSDASGNTNDVIINP